MMSPLVFLSPGETGRSGQTGLTGHTGELDGAGLTGEAGLLQTSLFFEKKRKISLKVCALRKIVITLLIDLKR